MQSTVQRRLAAILAADVVSYGRLMGADEMSTLEALKAHRRELIDPAIAAHHGRIVKTMGDGALVEFASVVDAVGCAVVIQRRMVVRNAGVEEDKRIIFRIGINVGDIIIDEDDMVAFVLASYLEQTRWWIFFGLVVTLTGVRAAGWRCYYHNQKTEGAPGKWALFATAGSGLSGLLWGLGSTLLLPDNIVEQTFFAFVIGGMCAGALVSLSYYLPAFIAYVYASVLPLAWSFLLDGRTVYVAMGCMALVFAAAVTFAAHHFNRAFVSGFRLNVDLAKRTEDLTRQTEELTAVNSRLEAEIAQRENAESQLHQAQKLEALGQLTGGIAHDFNNLLTAVIGNLELAKNRTGGDPQTSRLLESALSAADRGATLIQDLLTFARRQPLHPKVVDISAVLDDAEKILRQTIGPNIRLVRRSEPGLKPAWVDPNQLELAILNLALNARDAMPGGGTLHMGCENRRADAGNGPAELITGDYLVVSVSDTGTGMSEATLARVFEPFLRPRRSDAALGWVYPSYKGSPHNPGERFGYPAPSAKARQSSCGCRAPRVDRPNAFP